MADSKAKATGAAGWWAKTALSPTTGTRAAPIPPGGSPTLDTRDRLAVEPWVVSQQLVRTGVEAWGPSWLRTGSCSLPVLCVRPGVLRGHGSWRGYRQGERP